MIRFSFFLLFCILFSTGTVAQKIVAFDKLGKVKRVRYFVGEYISLKMLNKARFAGVIQRIDTKSFMLNGTKIPLDSVQKVYNTQTGMGYRLGASVFIVPAVGYMPLIITNGLINNDSPIIKQNQLYYGGGFIALAAIFGYLANRPFKISEKRPLKIIDVSI